MSRFALIFAIFACLACAVFAADWPIKYQTSQYLYTEASSFFQIRATNLPVGDGQEFTLKFNIAGVGAQKSKDNLTAVSLELHTIWYEGASREYTTTSVNVNCEESKSNTVIGEQKIKFAPPTKKDVPVSAQHIVFSVPTNFLELDNMVINIELTSPEGNVYTAETFKVPGPSPKIADSFELVLNRESYKKEDKFNRGFEFALTNFAQSDIKLFNFQFLFASNSTVVSFETHKKLPLCEATISHKTDKGTIRTTYSATLVTNTVNDVNLLSSLLIHAIAEDDTIPIHSNISLKCPDHYVSFNNEHDGPTNWSIYTQVQTQDNIVAYGNSFVNKTVVTKNLLSAGIVASIVVVAIFSLLGVLAYIGGRKKLQSLEENDSLITN
jgi:hypothetical protein